VAWSAAQCPPRDHGNAAKLPPALPSARATDTLDPERAPNFGGRGGRNNPNKLFAEDIAATIMAALAMPRRVLWPELAVFANNPWKES
jgi:hypothetical protein